MMSCFFMFNEIFSTEQLRSIWDKVNQEVKRCARAAGLDGENLEARLIRPLVDEESRRWHQWANDPTLVDETGHLISRVLMIGTKGMGVKEGKYKIVPIIDRWYYQCFVLTWDNKPLTYLRMDEQGMNIAGTGINILMNKDNLLFADVLVLEKETSFIKGVAMVPSLPRGFKEVFNRKTGMMLARP